MFKSQGGQSWGDHSSLRKKKAVSVVSLYSDIMDDILTFFLRKLWSLETCWCNRMLNFNFWNSIHITYYFMILTLCLHADTSLYWVSPRCSQTIDIHHIFNGFLIFLSLPMEDFCVDLLQIVVYAWQHCIDTVDLNWWW